MIRHVRRHFICFTMCILTGAVLLPMIALNVIPALMSYNQNKVILEQAVQNEIRLRTPKPTPQPDHQPSEANPFTVTTAVTTTVEVTTSHSTTTVTETMVAAETAPPESTVLQPQNSSQPQKTGTKPTQTKPTQTKPSVLTRPSIQTTVKQPQTIPNEPPPPGEDDDPNEEDDEPWKDPPPYENDFPWQPHPWDASISIFPQTATQKKWNSEPPAPKGDSSSDYFLAVLDTNGNLTETIHADWYDYTEEEVQTLVEEVQKSKKQDGRFDTLQFHEQDYQMGSIVAFIDCAKDLSFLQQLMIVSIIIFILMESIVLLLTMMLTKRAMLPMQISFEKQKQFISDAGHELKTPLTIISANADILQDEIGENKWLDYIRMQTERMRVLVDEMMALTKMEYSNNLDTAERFNLSSAVETMALPFESQAFEQQKQFLITVQPDLYFHGNPEQIRRMIGILIDNAFKYSAEHGEIKVSLKEETGGRAVLEVYNTGKGVREDETEKIFERFYRSDSSRARATGGYGLGLSIAKSVAEAHKIKIEVNSVPDHWITFTLVFPPQKK
ncbi:MAG: ATP-binding protein [Oscillospiraceae bacterium]|nr:ATP-binding protein [Oscillospiraceae bacterium]